MKSTDFAPAKRMDSEIVHEQARLLNQKFALNDVLDTVPQILMVLNRERQVIYANQQFMDYLEVEDLEPLFGKRPGEVLNCIHASETAGGCGTTEFCRECGAVNAILEAQKGRPAIQECRILTLHHDALDLRGWAKPLQVDGEEFTLFTVADIADEKRREALERTFFHDILNTAGNILGASSLMEDHDEEIKAQLNDMIRTNSVQLVNEIRSHQMLMQAEKGMLSVQPEALSSKLILEKVLKGYALSPLAREKTIRIDPEAADADVTCDEALITRVIGNLLKNALEATSAGKTIVLNTVLSGNEIVFSVHSPKAMPPEVRHQVFQRSFSTKGAGRGTGTYSVKLYTERYLHGRTWFETSEEQGTTFFVALPVLSQA